MRWWMMIGLTSIILISGCITELDDADDYTEQTAFGEAHAKDVTITIASQDVYYPLTDMNAGQLNGFTYADGNLTATYDGNYLITSQWSFDGGANNEYHLSIFKNNVKINHCHAERVIGSGADVGSASLSCIEPLTAGDYINTHIENASGTANSMIHDSTTNITRLSN